MFLPLEKKNFKIVLASKSPRRQFLMKELGLNFEVVTKEVDETFPLNFQSSEVAIYLSRKKAFAFTEPIEHNTLIITADTIVWIDDKALNKPINEAEAKIMLRTLSGRMHEVHTGVTLKSNLKIRSFSVMTKVYFKCLTEEEIDFYTGTYKPYDKAGAYGAQEWIGFVAVEKIEGSYFNVMGLPTKELYEELLKF